MTKYKSKAMRNAEWRIVFIIIIIYLFIDFVLSCFIPHGLINYPENNSRSTDYWASTHSFIHSFKNLYSAPSR